MRRTVAGSSAAAAIDVDSLPELPPPPRPLVQQLRQLLGEQASEARSDQNTGNINEYRRLRVAQVAVLTARCGGVERLVTYVAVFYGTHALLALPVCAALLSSLQVRRLVAIC
jgi:hypothetical protein